MKYHIGYLSNTSVRLYQTAFQDRVVCLECMSALSVSDRFATTWSNLYNVDVGNYHQSCHQCGKRIHQGKTPAWSELYPDMSDQLTPDLHIGTCCQDDRVDILPTLMTMRYSKATEDNAVRVCDIFGSERLFVSDVAFPLPWPGNEIENDGPYARQAWAMNEAFITYQQHSWTDRENLRMTGWLAGKAQQRQQSLLSELPSEAPLTREQIIADVDALETLCGSS